MQTSPSMLSLVRAGASSAILDTVPIFCKILIANGVDVFC